jgi:hypothetical protein
MAAAIYAGGGGFGISLKVCPVIGSAGSPGLYLDRGNLV